MVWILAVVLTVIVFLWICCLCWRVTFFRHTDRLQDIYAVPPGKQYEPIAERMLAAIHAVDGLPYDIVSIKSGDGTFLCGRYYHFADSAPVQILFHGYRSNGIREFAGIHSLSRELGINVLVVDQRAHGNSGGKSITFGIQERFDCLAWANYAAQRFGEHTPIILSGTSMGAATVLMASELELPENVAAITADCPYSEPGEIIRKVCRDIKLPARAAYACAATGALLFGGFRLWDASPVKAVTRTRIPILLIHGDDDRFVPCEMSQRIYAACVGPAELVFVPGGAHGVSCYTDPALYKEAFRDFLFMFGVIKNAPQQ